MTKKLDLNKTVYELTQEYPELIDILADLGFKEITKKPVRRSAGKIMTIPKGAKMKNIPMADVAAVLIRSGFELDGDIPTSAPDERMQKLKSYLKRLGSGEDLKSVRADFVREFGDVEASEIMQAEQELMKEGTPVSEVSKLCDIHSALFHGATREEKIANAEKEVEESLRRQKVDVKEKRVQAARLEAIPGHPLSTLTKENHEFSDLLSSFRQTRDVSLLPKFRELSVHYAKKGDLLYPLLKARYDISGPAEVMWTVDDEIRDELGALTKEQVHDDRWKDRLDAVLTRAEEMVYKEQNILFPICAVNFTEDEWRGIYRDARDYAVCFGVEPERWEEGERAEAVRGSLSDDEVVMPGGHLTVQQLTALLNTIPIEISFVDADNINRFFNEGPKAFKRASAAIDREVFDCHPPKVEPIVRQIIDDFRNNRRDCVPVWMEKGGHTMLVRYMAVRDKEGRYIGTAELVQDMESAKEHFLGKQA